jgi:dTDP-glucose 4,6-dehydratase
MRLLITGGMGFIGAATIRYILTHRDWQILNVDKLTYAADPARLESTGSTARYGFCQADIADGARMRELFAGFRPTAILHMAAESHVDRSIRNAAPFIQTNIVGSYSLLETASQYWESLPAADRLTFRFHQVSTDEVYGDLGPGGAFDEQTPYAPSSPYSASKASADMLAKAWHRTYGLPVLISTCSNNYGPWQHAEKFIPTVLRSAMSGRPIPIFGDGNNVREWLYVDDHAAALVAILERGAVGQTYCVGSQTESSNLALARRLCRILDDMAPAAVPHETAITFVSDRPGHDWRYALDASKIRGELNWRPATELDDGLRQTVGWYLKHRDWLEQGGATLLH